MSRKKSIANDKHNFKNGKLEADNIYVNPELIDIKEVTGFEPRKGLEKFLMVDTEDHKKQIVNIVSTQYGLLSNEQFFPMIESRLDDAGIGYQKRSINRKNRSFAVDYILEDDSLHVKIKNGKDLIKPMIRVINCYDGSNKTTGHFGFFREICSNGLHVANSELKFQLMHRGNMIELAMPKVEELVASFMDNEYYSLHKKFEVMAEKPLTDVEGFVKYTLGKTGLFKYEKSEKNPEEASASAQLIIDVINAEAKELGTAPNLWLGYNAFNDYVHTHQNNQYFNYQERDDRKLFNAILQQVN